MSEDALGKRISGGIPTRRVGLSRMMLGWVGVKIGVKLAAFQHTGMSPAIMMGYTGSPGVYTR